MRVASVFPRTVGAALLVVLALWPGSVLSQVGRGGQISQSVTPLRTGIAPFRSNPAGPPPIGAVGPPPIGATGPIPLDPTGPPPLGAVGPPPLNAVGRPPLGAVGPPPIGATGQTPFNVTGSPPFDAVGEPPLDATGPPPLDATGPPPLDATGPTPEDPTGPPPFGATGEFVAFVTEHGMQQAVSASFFCEGHGRGFAGQKSFQRHLLEAHGMSFDDGAGMLVDQGGVWTLPAW